MPFGRLIILSFMLAAVSMAGAQSRLRRYEFAQVHMGTQFRIVLYASNGGGAGKAADLAYARIVELDGMMSDYREESELNRLCRMAGGPPVKVSDDLFRIIKICQSWS